MTEAEGVLWERLRRKSMLGVKFRRQQIIEGFIADFFCEAAKLVIEIDGGVHDLPDQKKIDEHRRKVFEARGLKELRFSNERVMSDINGVLQEIGKVLEKK
jgi:very-short-patch-repair endonuclease